MKKIINLFGITLILSVILSLSCSKSDFISNNDESDLSQKRQRILHLIDNFKLKLNNPLKDGSVLSVDSAIWYIEATLNQTYARSDNSRDVISQDSTFITIPLATSNTILFSDIENAYNQIVDSLAFHYYSITGDRGLIMADIQLKTLGSNYLILKMTDIITSSSYLPQYQFGSTDYWIWGYNLGKCNGYSGGTPWDASSKLQQYANWSILVLPNSFYTNINETGVILPDNVPTTGNPYGYYPSLLFQASGMDPEVNQCLSPDQMNYYLSCLKAIGNSYKPVGKDIIKYSCFWTIGLVPQGYWLHLHYATIRYGIQITYPLPAEEL